MTQSEPELEQNLIQRLTGLGYEPVTISNAVADLGRYM
jgi:type I restriction enzyme, R subunit